MSGRSTDKVEVFLNGPIASRIQIPGRVIVRRGKMSLAGFRGMTAQGEIATDGEPLCDLELGGQVIATGRIEEQDGEFYFVAQEDSDE
jgi:hypothetical protein